MTPRLTHHVHRRLQLALWRAVLAAPVRVGKLGHKVCILARDLPRGDQISGPDRLEKVGLQGTQQGSGADEAVRAQISDREYAELRDEVAKETHPVDRGFKGAE